MTVPAVHPASGALAVAGVEEPVDLGFHRKLGCHLAYRGEQLVAGIGLQVRSYRALARPSCW
jgi:hypothetical protein